MLDPRDRVGFAVEALAGVRSDREVWVKHLDSHVTLEGRVAPAIHRRHAAGADLFQHLEALTEHTPFGHALVDGGVVYARHVNLVAATNLARRFL